MSKQGWHHLFDGAPWYEKAGAYPIAAYSEFMPPPRLGRKAYRFAEPEPLPFFDKDPRGWYITEYEEAMELRPGLAWLAGHVHPAIVHLGQTGHAHALGKLKLVGNPYWPEELAARAGRLEHERYVLLLSLALARTQDDKGRVRWTLFGNSEQGPAKAFWKSFYTAPGRETPPEAGHDFIRRLLKAAYAEEIADADGLRKAGFRILPQGEPLYPWWLVEDLPSWTKPFVWNGTGSVRGIRYLLTFRPFSRLPRAVQAAYFDGTLHLLPFPGSLLFWGTPGARSLGGQRPMFLQAALQSLAPRHEAPTGLRVPQAGWMHEPHEGSDGASEEHFGTFKNYFRRTHRFAAVLRDQDELALAGQDDKLLHALFSTLPDDLGLYGKPMARNVQLWTHDFHILLDGPNANGAEIKSALHKMEGGGVFGYRFAYPPMRVGRYEVYWHRPLVAFAAPDTHATVTLDDAPLGYLTAYRAGAADVNRPYELWPRLLHRELPSLVLDVLNGQQAHCLHQEARNVRHLLDAWRLRGEVPLEPSLARRIIKIAHDKTLETWLKELPSHATDHAKGQTIAAGVRELIAKPQAGRKGRAKKAASYTYRRTANRAFEVRYWKTIAFLAEGRYRNKNNADCVRDASTLRHLAHHHRDLEALGDYILDYYRKVIHKAGLTGKAFAGDLPFHWRTDFDFSIFGGWLANQEQATSERDLFITIPGRDHSRAVIMGDHYDTAYMYDEYHDKGSPRIAAAGADDNHSATAALMLAAPVLLEMSRAGTLGCDVWLIHLTGEEFPADCMGARYLVQQIVERRLQQHIPGGKPRNLSKVRVQGAYVLDMVAHNNPRERDVFQISPGTGRASLWLAEQAHIANEIWNASTEKWNRRPARRQLHRAQRSTTGSVVPPPFRFLPLAGEVRVPNDPRSTLYNTDGLIFSDAGVPAVLFMENYDINRSGYHDTHDTMENIDLDYGAAFAAIAIETVARAACATPP
jgi:Peptidase family M28